MCLSVTKVVVSVQNKFSINQDPRLSTPLGPMTPALVLEPGISQGGSRNVQREAGGEVPGASNATNFVQIGLFAEGGVTGALFS